MPVSLSACGSYVGILTAEKALLYTSALEPVAQTEQDGTAVAFLPVRTERPCWPVPERQAWFLP